MSLKKYIFVNLFTYIRIINKREKKRKYTNFLVAMNFYQRQSWNYLWWNFYQR
jgi:predicted ABC-type exoprotein transport system permease subunit